MRALTGLLCALALAGCAGNRLYFRPAGGASGGTGEGVLPVMSIPLVGGDGAVQGTLCLRSQGIYAIAIAPGDRPRRVLHVEVLLVNGGDAPLRMELGAQRIESRADLPALLPAQLRVNGDPAEALVVAPRTSADADLLFALKGQLDEQCAQGFELSWQIDSPQTSFQGWSAFVPIAPADPAYPRQAYRGIWKGYFFPGHAAIPDWGRELFFAPFERPLPVPAREGR